MRRLWRNGTARFALVVLATLLLLALAAPWLGSVDPAAMDAGHIDAPAGEHATFTLPDGSSVDHTYWMGGDAYGRDLWSRVLYGTRASLLVAGFTACIAVAFGALLGLAAGYFRPVDAVLMRVLDGLMAIPSILLAITLVATLGATLATVVVAIAVPEIPRVARLVRSLVLSLREEPFVEAARGLGTPPALILWRHVLPNAMAPLLVQGSFIAASAVLTEAALSFLGLGLPADVPTWGNIMADGRTQFTQFPGHVLFPALFLVPMVLAINLLGDALRDLLDPRSSAAPR